MLKIVELRPFGRNVIIGLLLVSVAALLCFGIIGVGRNGAVSNGDGAVLYAAGRAWLSDLSPYHHQNLLKSIAGTTINLTEVLFFYPPPSSAICLFLALFSYPVAKVIWLFINLIAIAAIIALTHETIKQHAKTSLEKLGSWVMAAVIIGNPFTTHVVWMGQTSLVALATTMAAWVFSQRKNWLLAGICLGMATFKPQICFLLVLWFLFQREWKILLVALGSAGVLSLYPMVKWGPIGMMLDWKEGISEGYSSLGFNAPGFQHAVGLRSLLESAGVSVPSLTLIAVALVVLMWLFRDKIDIKDVLSILMSITFIFVGYSHDYDYVCLVPVMTSLWLYSCNTSKAWLVNASLVALLFIPQRLFRPLGIPALNHWRTLVVLGFLIIVIGFSLENRKKEKAAAMTYV